MKYNKIPVWRDCGKVGTAMNVLQGIYIAADTLQRYQRRAEHVRNCRAKYEKNVVELAAMMEFDRQRLAREWAAEQAKKAR